jgi:hypothetical protein
MTYTPLVVPQSLAAGEDIQLQQVDRNLAVSASGFGIGTNLVGFIVQDCATSGLALTLRRVLGK